MTPLFPLLLLACAAQTVTFADLIENAAELDGEEIEVEGWLKACTQRTCAFRMKEEGPDNRYLSISGQSPAYADVLDHAPGKVRIVAKFNATCVINPCLGSSFETLVVSSVQSTD